MGGRRKPKDQSSQGRGPVENGSSLASVNSGAALGDLARRLSTEDGRREAFADLYQRGLRGGTRDETSGLILAKQCVAAFAEMDANREVPEKLADLAAQLADVKAALAGRKGSALRAADAVVPPMEGSALRTDMAPTPALEGHREPYKS